MQCSGYFHESNQEWLGRQGKPGEFPLKREIGIADSMLTTPTPSVRISATIAIEWGFGRPLRTGWQRRKRSGMTAPRVLVADDSKTVRRLLTRQLRDIGATVVEAENGALAFDLARSNSFDLIISDIDMPVMDGFSLCRKLKSGPATRAVPVIILSTNESEDFIERGFRVGAAAYVAKSAATTQLLPRVKEVLDRTSFNRKRLILVVDDSMFIRNTVQKGLTSAGFNVVCADSGDAALDILRKDRPDLILSDIHMPGMDGMDLCRAVRADHTMGAVPFVVMSTESDRLTMRRMVHSGASAFMVKPFNIEQLVITLEKLLSDHFRILHQEKERLETERSLMLASIASLVQALEARDRYTRGHSDNVARIATGIGLVMGFDREEMEWLEIAARLHDVGKIGVRDDILLKPGKLTSSEFMTIQSHTIHGAEILAPIPSLSRVIQAVRSHHEKMDGSGYPDHLEGEEIPLWARIIAVADVFDALTSERPYRKALTLEKALSIIDEQCGSHLCPTCVAAFKRYLDAGQRATDCPCLSRK